MKLLVHKHKKNLLCHYCGFKGNLNRKCIKNEICDFIFSGPGVERIAEEIKKIFPNEVNISQIPTIHVDHLTKHKFKTLTNNFRTPLVVKGFFKDSIAVKKWNLNFFKKLIAGAFSNIINIVYPKYDFRFQRFRILLESSKFY